MITQAAVVTEPGAAFNFRDVQLDDPRPDEIIVKMVSTGICHTDISVRDTLPADMFPRVLGHEGAGIVEQVGSEVTKVAVGDPVILSLDACGQCANCTSKGPGYCENTLILNYMGFRMDGSTTYTMDEAPLHGQFLGQSSFSAYALATERNAVKVAPGTDLSRLGPYGCSFMTGAGTVLNILDPKRGSDTDTLVVYGVGAVGLAALAAARGRYQTFAVDLQASRLEAAVRLGATAINPAESEDLVALIKELTNGHGANFAIDTTGKTAVVKQMVQALAIKGTAVILALGDATAELDAVDVMMNGKQIVGAIMGDSDPHQTIPELLRMAAAGEFMVDDLITAYPVAQINEAIADAESGKVVKPVLVW